MVQVFPLFGTPLITINLAITLSFLWEVGSKRPIGINIEKAWNLTFAYSLLWGSGMTLPTRINNECPRRYAIRCKAQRKIHTKGHLSLSCFGLVKFSGFQSTKTSANKRLLLCLWKILVRVKGRHTRPHAPAWIISTAKVVNYFGLSKRRAFFSQLF